MTAFPPRFRIPLTLARVAASLAVALALVLGLTPLGGQAGAATPLALAGTTPSTGGAWLSRAIEATDTPTSRSSSAPPPATSPTPASDASCDGSQLPGPLPAHPTAHTAGVPAGTPLRTVNGDYHTQAHGEVVDRLNITGRLYISHDDVKVKCTRVWRMTTNRGLRLQMWLSTLGDHRGVREGSALKFSNYTLRRVDIFGTFDGLKAEGNVDVRDSYFHDLYRTSDTSQSSGKTHNDAVQIGKGSNMVFRHNTFHMWSFSDGQTAGIHQLKTPWGDGAGYTTSAFMIVADSSSPVSNVLIEDNVIRGRTSKHVHVAGAVSGVRILNNRMGRENRDYPQMFAVPSSTTRTGNVFFDDGTPANR